MINGVEIDYTLSTASLRQVLPSLIVKTLREEEIAKIVFHGLSKQLLDEESFVRGLLRGKGEVIYFKQNHYNLFELHWMILKRINEVSRL